jgi:hypothetical protein
MINSKVIIFVKLAGGNSLFLCSANKTLPVFASINTAALALIERASALVIPPHRLTLTRIKSVKKEVNKDGKKTPPLTRCVLYWTRYKN